jgi:hypothetical protein
MERASPIVYTGPSCPACGGPYAYDVLAGGGIAASCPNRCAPPAPVLRRPPTASELASAAMPEPAPGRAHVREPRRARRVT